MEEPPKRTKKHSLLKRFCAAIACLLIFGGAIATWIVGLNAVIIAVFVAASGLVIGPAMTQATEGILEVLLAVVELMIEGVLLIVEAIAGIFSGF